MLRMQHFVKDGDPMKHDLLDEIESNKKKQRSEELHRDSEESLRRAREDDAARRSYEQRLRRQKLELMKLKQGQIEEDEIEQEKEPEKREYTFREKVSNFFYHYKFHVIAISVVVLFVGFLTVDYLRTVRPDIQAMFIADDYGMTYRCENITECWSSYTPDLNHDRKNVARLYYIPTNYTDTDAASMYMAQADRTKLIGEFQSGETIIIIGNKQAYDMLGVTEGVFVDMREIFPDDPNAEELGYRLAATDFKELVDYPEMDDSQLYISLRKPVKTFGMSEEAMEKNYNDALALVKAYIADHRKA